MSKNILIISELFEPMNAIGAIRPSKLAKFLADHGYNVTVYTSISTLSDKQYNPTKFTVLYDKPQDNVKISGSQTINTKNVSKRKAYFK